MLVFLKSARFLKSACFLKNKTVRFALGPKNVHQPWPLALYSWRKELGLPLVVHQNNTKMEIRNVQKCRGASPGGNREFMAKGARVSRWSFTRIGCSRWSFTRIARVSGTDCTAPRCSFARGRRPVVVLRCNQTVAAAVFPCGMRTHENARSEVAEDAAVWQAAARQTPQRGSSSMMVVVDSVQVQRLQVAVGKEQPAPLHGYEMYGFQARPHACGAGSTLPSPAGVQSVCRKVAGRTLGPRKLEADRPT